MGGVFTLGEQAGTAAGASIEEAIYLVVLLERAARMQLLAQSVGTMRKIAPEHAREAHDFLLKPGIVNGSF